MGNCLDSSCVSLAKNTGFYEFGMELVLRMDLEKLHAHRNIFENEIQMHSLAVMRGLVYPWKKKNTRKLKYPVFAVDWDK